MAGEKFIVLVCDKDDSKHGEISVVDDADKAERLVETLLEAGFEEERIRVFTGRSSGFQVSHRPTVALVTEDEAPDHPSPMMEAVSLGSAVSPVEPEALHTMADAEAAETPETESPTQQELEDAEAPAEADAAEPVRFSSLFRSA